MEKRTLKRHSIRTNLLIFLATIDDFLVDISYDNVYKQLRIPGYKRKTAVESVRRMFKAEEIECYDQSLRLTERGKQIVDSFIPVRKFAKEKWDGLWRLIIFDIPECNRIKRDQLRQLLKLYGYFKWQKSVYLTPHPVIKAVNEWLEEAGLYPQAICFESRQVGGFSQRELAEMVFNHHKRLTEWHRLMTNFGDMDHSKWVRRWEELMVSDPWLPQILESEEIFTLRQKAGQLMKQIMRQ